MNAFCFRGIAAFSALVAFGLLGNPGRLWRKTRKEAKSPSGRGSIR
jgi:hypothetical protein